MTDAEFEILEHTADAKFRAEGDSLEKAFKASVEAFSEIVGGGSGIYTHEIEAKSENLDALLFDFMDELIFLQDTRNVAVSHASGISVEELNDGWRLQAEIMVDNITSETDFTDIKAPTYSEMDVGFDDGRWYAQAVLDI